MEGFKDENYSWYRVAGFAVVVYIALFLYEMVTGKGTIIIFLSSALGRLTAAAGIAGLLVLVLAALKFRFLKVTWSLMIAVVAVLAIMGNRGYSIADVVSDSQTAKVAQVIQTQPDSSQKPSPADIQSELVELGRVHPDFAQIASDPVFIEWVNKQPANIKALYASTSAKDNIKLLDEYKKAKAHQAKVRSDYINKIISEKPKPLFEILPVSDNEPNSHLFSGNGLNETLVTYKSAGDLINVSEKDSKYFRSGIFIGYVIGVFDAASNTLFCAPQGFTIQQAIDVSVSYIENKPDRRHFSGSRLVLEALTSKYPCKK